MSAISRFPDFETGKTGQSGVWSVYRQFMSPAKRFTRNVQMRYTEKGRVQAFFVMKSAWPASHTKEWFAILCCHISATTFSR